MPAAAYKGSSSWAVSSSPHQLPAGDQLGSPADTPIGPKPPSNGANHGANHGLPTPPPRWISIAIHHPVNFKPIAVSSAFAAARAAPAVPRRISFGRSIPVPVGHSAPAQAINSQHCHQLLLAQCKLSRRQLEGSRSSTQTAWHSDRCPASVRLPCTFLSHHSRQPRLETPTMMKKTSLTGQSRGASMV